IIYRFAILFWGENNLTDSVLVINRRIIQAKIHFVVQQLIIGTDIQPRCLNIRLQTINLFVVEFVVPIVSYIVTLEKLLGKTRLLTDEFILCQNLYLFPGLIGKQSAQLAQRVAYYGLTSRKIGIYFTGSQLIITDYANHIVLQRIGY